MHWVLLTNVYCVSKLERWESAPQVVLHILGKEEVGRREPAGLMLLITRPCFLFYIIKLKNTAYEKTKRTTEMFT